MMTFGSLFAGIGGFDLGLERAGMQCAWQVEIDPFCQKVLAKHWPDVARYKDVKEVHGAVAHAKRVELRETLPGGVAETAAIQREHWAQDDTTGRVGRTSDVRRTSNGHGEASRICPSCLPPVDLICGGFPCQPHSHAGKRKGAADDRDLWPEYRRIIAELRPRWVIGENVPGIVTTILDQVLSDLESMGYSWKAFVIPAVAFDAPHRRDRVWVVAVGNSDELRQHSGRAEQSLSGHRLDGAESVEHTDLSRNGNRWAEPGNGAPDGAKLSGETPASVAHTQERTERAGLRQSEQGRQRGRRLSNGSSAGGGWATEPDVGRVAHGVPARVDRLRALGNAVVPQVVEFIGRLIVEAERAT